MESPPAEIQPDDPKRLPPAKRRRARRRLFTTLTADKRAIYLEAATQRTRPSFDFFLFSLLSGSIFTIGLLFDSPHLLLLGALLAPLMSPVVGISLGTALGSARSFGSSLGALLVGAFLVVVVGAFGGFASQIWEPYNYSQALLHTSFSITSFVLLAVAAPITCASMVRDRFNPAIFSVALAYTLYIPLAAAGFGLGSGIDFLWPDGLIVFAILLAWATLLGAVTLAFMGFRPYSLFGYSLGGAVLLLGVIIGIAAFGAGAVAVTDAGLPTPVPSLTPTFTPSLTITPSPEPPTATLTSTLTLTPTFTSTQTPTPSPTPALARVFVQDGQGVFLRSEPAGPIISSLLNGTLVQILPVTPVNIDGAIWVTVLVLEIDQEGWILRSLLVTPTPNPISISPTSTSLPADTQTPSP